MNYYALKKNLAIDTEKYLLRCQEGTAETLEDFKLEMLKRYGASDKMILKTIEKFGLTIKDDKLVKKC